MAYKKLSESEKQEILHRAQSGNETINALAEQYGVSSSTIRRLLKGGSDETAAPAAASTNGIAVTPVQSAPSGSETLAVELAVESPAPVVATPAADPVVAKPTLVDRRVRRRSSLPEATTSDLTPVSQVEAVATVQLAAAPALQEPAVTFTPSPAELTDRELAEELASEELESDDDLDDLDDLDDDFDDFDEDDSDIATAAPHLKPGNLVDILPLSEATLPRICYLVVDRVAELVARPLKDFGDLGQIPVEEVQSRTLPVFDNHRVAKRFANPRTQRVIKLPDGQVLQKTSTHLYAKGITRLLVNGQVYSL